MSKFVDHVQKVKLNDQGNVMCPSVSNTALFGYGNMRSRVGQLEKYLTHRRSIMSYTPIANMASLPWDRCFSVVTVAMG